MSALFLELVGMALVAFAAFEIYSLNKKGASVLSEFISWSHYPWVIMILGVVLMVPFHKQIWKAKQYVKQQQQLIKKKERPDF
ncbi:MAG: hypothetical protein HWD86_09725 [Kangiellaceae bacterium]|nr:hypothetical protein [Kangiellaceae bacterium]